MKTVSLLTTLLLLPVILSAQWVSKGSNGISNVNNNGFLGVHAPSEDVVWGFVWNIANFAPSQVFVKSTDGGQTFTTGTITVDDSSLTPLGMYALDDMTAWAGMVSEPCQCYGQVYKTTDGGDTWVKQLAMDAEQAMGGIHFFDENEGFVYGSNGTGATSDQFQLFRTTNGGDTWIEATPSAVEVGEGMWLGSGSGIFSTFEDHIWIGTRLGRVFHSSDRGLTWDVSESLATGRMINSVSFKDALHGIAFSGVSSSGFFASKRGWSTQDGGATWTEIEIPSEPAVLSSQHVPGTPNTYIFSGGWDDQGMAVTTDGGIYWTTLETPNLISLSVVSPTAAYAGGFILGENRGGIYKFVSSFEEDHVNVQTVLGSTVEGVLRSDAETTRLWNAKGMTMDEDGNLYVSGDYANQIVKRSTNGTVETLAGSGLFGYQDGTAEEATFARPHGLTLDENGDVLVADYLNSVIRKVDSDGTVSTWAGTGDFGGIDGPKEEASFTFISDIVRDTFGNYYIADNNRIRKISPDGITSTLAGSDVAGFEDGPGSNARFNFIWGMGIDLDGNIYTADFFNHAIRKITPDGIVTTVAGNGLQGYSDAQGLNARFNYPEDVAADAAGNLYVADGQNYRVRKITPDGTVTTFAGVGTPTQFFLNDGQSAIDGDGSLAQFGRLRGIMVQPNGNILVNSWSNDAIREIQPGIPSNPIVVTEVNIDKPFISTTLRQANVFQYEGVVQNTSDEILENVQMICEVSLDGTTIFTGASDLIDMAPQGNDFLEVSNAFEFTEAGDYDVRFEFISEDEGTFAVLHRNLLLSDSLLANTDGFRYYFYGFEDDNANWFGTIGQEYNLLQPDSLAGVQYPCFIAAGTAVQFAIWKRNINEVPTELIYVSEEILFDTTFFGSYYLELPQPILLDAAQYVFAIQRNSNDGYLQLPWDTDHQSEDVWVQIPAANIPWSRWNDFVGNVPTICGTMISPVFGGEDIIIATQEWEKPDWTVTVSPNPFTDQVSIQTNSDTPLMIQLMDAHGRLIQTFTHDGGLAFERDFSELPSGVYFLRLSDGLYSTSRRVVKQ